MIEAIVIVIGGVIVGHPLSILMAGLLVVSPAIFAVSWLRGEDI